MQDVKIKAKILPRYFLVAALLIQSFVALGSFYWFFELFTHYAPYYVLIALGFAGFHFYKKESRWASWWLILFAINLVPLWPYLTTEASDHASSSEEPTLTVLAQNVYYENTDSTEFYERVNEVQPDVFIVNEANASWAKTTVPTDYPYSTLTQKTGIHGIFMGSKVPGTFTEIPLGDQVGLEFIPIDQSYRVLGVHPEAPLTSTWAAARNEQFADLVTYSQASELPTVIIGDFNCTPWSPHFKSLLAQTGFTDSRLGFGFKSTWKANNPLFWLPIDHALVSPGLEILDFETHRTEVSDHKAIEVKLSF